MLPVREHFDGREPKRTAGMRRFPPELIPRVALVQEAAVLGLGADCPAKAYGRHNWRADPIDAETYVGAIERHLTLWAAGEGLDEQSGVSHLAHIRATCGILLDAIDAGTFLDGRLRSPETIRLLKAYDAFEMPVVAHP
ncbi:dATP/dGTP diphosphohydrolase domain-containing protein [Methylorubrum thiocyanatum]|uniref:dATP/dGTP diphosphohydrolase domain-containing protein n=1 Tax=Methylorubrum thiocyanatum TaxID=47958 RepID=UPI0035C7A3D8